METSLATMTTPPENTPEPLLVSKTYGHGNITMTVESTDLKSEPYVRLKGDNDDELIIPLRYLEGISRNQSMLNSESFFARDELQRAQHYPATERGPCVSVSRNKHQLIRTGADAEVEGTPILEWRPQRPDQMAGWQLTLVGGEGVAVGFAAWDDEAGINSLVEMMDDPDGVIALAGMIAPESTARLSARITAVNLRANRDLPSVTLPKVRKVLQNANLSSETVTEDSSRAVARMRSLAVRVGERKIPVAVGIVAESIPWGTPPLRAEENALPYRERSEIMEERAKDFRDKWTEKAKKALTDAGWRIVELPQPSLGWRGSSTGRTAFWVTLVDPETWSGLNAAATAEARYVDMPRGGVL